MSLGVNIIGAVVTIGLFLFVNPVAGVISALAFGIVAIRVANAERRGSPKQAGPGNWRDPNAR